MTSGLTLRVMATSVVWALASAILTTGTWPGAALGTDATPLQQRDAEKIESLRRDLAAQLDQRGSLTDALPLYQQQAEHAPTIANRLRYAGALLRAGRTQEAQGIYHRLLKETAATPHGGAAGEALLVCAASMMRSGFPQLAVDYVRPAFRPESADPTIGLVLAHAQCAAGDVNGARTVLQQIDRDSNTWQVGLRIELARLKILLGDVQRGRALLDNIDHAVGQMYRDSILANVSVREREWAKASETLAAAESKAPQGIHARKIARQWRNVQREIRSVQLRRAICLWKEGKRDLALDELIKAEMTDEEYVRSAALVLQVANDLLVEKSQANALSNLDALAGHDVRLAEGIAQLKGAIRTGGEAAPALTTFKDALAKLDRTSDFVTTPLFEILSETLRPGKATAAVDKPPVAAP